jgi:hypothetical protein
LAGHPSNFLVFGVGKVPAEERDRPCIVAPVDRQTPTSFGRILALKLTDELKISF